MATTYGLKPNSALSFAVERDNLLQCYDAMESTGSKHWQDAAGIYSGSAVRGTAILNETDGWGRNRSIKYFTMGTSEYFLFEQYTQPTTCTLAVWIRINDTNAEEVLCSHFSGGPVSTFYSIETTGYMKFGYYDGDPGWKTITSSGTVVDDNVWHHCVWVRAGTNHTFYVDGSLDHSATATQANGGAVNVIGSKWAGGYKFTGDLAHFSVYEAKMTAAQVSNMYEHQRHRFGV
jgi:hypothetical protein